MKKLIKNTAVALLFAFAPLSGALALDTGDWIFRIGATGVYPESTSSDPVSTAATGPIPCTAVGPADAWSLGLTIGYAFSPNWSLELLAAYPFTHDVEANDTLQTTLQGLGLSGSKNIGEIKQLPPTLSAVYAFSPSSKVRPYLGAGLTYFYPFDEKVTGDLATVDNIKVSPWVPSIMLGTTF